MCKYYFFLLILLNCLLIACSSSKSKSKLNSAEPIKFDKNKVPDSDILNAYENEDYNILVTDICSCLQPLNDFKTKYQNPSVDKSNYNNELQQISKSINGCMKNFNNSIAVITNSTEQKSAVLEKVRALCPSVGNMMFPAQNFEKLQDL